LSRWRRCNHARVSASFRTVIPESPSCSRGDRDIDASFDELRVATDSYDLH
jgi:hypothetical protein